MKASPETELTRSYETLDDSFCDYQHREQIDSWALGRREP